MKECSKQARKLPFPNIRNLREDRDFSQNDLANYLEIAQNTYSQYETGKIALTPKILMALAELYQTSVDYLLGRTNDPRPPVKQDNFPLETLFHSDRRNPSTGVTRIL